MSNEQSEQQLRINQEKYVKRLLYAAVACRSAIVHNFYADTTVVPLPEHALIDMYRDNLDEMYIHRNEARILIYQVLSKTVFSQYQDRAEAQQAQQLNKSLQAFSNKVIHQLAQEEA